MGESSASKSLTVDELSDFLNAVAGLSYSLVSNMVPEELVIAFFQDSQFCNIHEKLGLSRLDFRADVIMDISVTITKFLCLCTSFFDTF